MAGRSINVMRAEVNFWAEKELIQIRYGRNILMENRRMFSLRKNTDVLSGQFNAESILLRLRYQKRLHARLSF